MNKKSRELFKAALNKACGEINEAARLSPDIFEGEELAIVRKELGHLMGAIDMKILARLDKQKKSKESE